MIVYQSKQKTALTIGLHMADVRESLQATCSLFDSALKSGVHMNVGLNTYDQAPLLAQLTCEIAGEVDQVGHNLLTAMLKRVWVVLQHHNNIKVKAVCSNTPFMDNCIMTIRNLFMAGQASMFGTYTCIGLLCDAQTETELVREVLCMLMATVGNTALHIHAISTHTFKTLEKVCTWPDDVPCNADGDKPCIICNILLGKLHTCTCRCSIVRCF